MKKKPAKKRVIKEKKIPAIEPMDISVVGLHRIYRQDYEAWFFRYSIILDGKKYTDQEILDTSDLLPPIRKEFSKRTYILTGVTIGCVLTLVAEYLGMLI